MDVITPPSEVELHLDGPPSMEPTADAVPAPNGAAAATLLGAGIGCAFFGLLVLLNDAVPWLQERLTLSKAVGPLSGKSSVGIAGWILAWGASHLRLRRRVVDMAPVVRATRLLVAASLLLTFPPFYLLFAAE